MKELITAILIFLPVVFFGQQQVKATETVTISGDVKSEKTLSAADLTKFTIRNIDDMVITNYSGEKKAAVTGLKGVLLKEVLASVDFKVENPKLLSEFFFTCIASDGYKVVYSWNEIFNTATGDNTYLVMEKEGKSIAEYQDRILELTTSDYKTGHRYIKGLSQIVIARTH